MLSTRSWSPSRLLRVTWPNFVGIWGLRAKRTPQEHQVGRKRSVLPYPCRFRQVPQMQHKLPALRFRQKAERRHPGERIAAADFPEQCAVALRLNTGLREVRRLGRAAAICTVTA